MKGLVAAIAIVTACACANTERQLGEALSAAQLELRRGQVNAAMEQADRGLALTTPGTVSAWRFRLLKSEVQIARLDMAAALPDLQAELPAGGEFNALRARQKYLHAQVQIAQGQLRPALETLDAAAAMATSDPDLTLDIAVLGSQARLRLGRWQEAEERLNNVLAQSTARADRYRQALALNNLGMSRLVRNRFDEALPWFERVIAYNDLEQTRIYAVSQNNAGICFARLGQFDRAVGAQRRAVEIHDRSGRKMELMQAVGELGTTYLLRDDVAQAVPYLQRALTIATEAGLAADGSVWARNLAAAAASIGKWDDAARFNEEAKRLNPADRPAKLVFNTATAAQVAAARGQTAEASRLFNEVLKTSASEPALQWVAHEGLAKLAVAGHQPKEAAVHFEAALNTVEKTRSALLKTDYKLSFLTRLIYFYRAYVDFLMDAGQIEQALEVADSSRGRVLSERLGVAAPSRSAASGLRKRAQQSGQALVFYWLAPQRSIAWVVTGSGIRSEVLPPRDQIEPLVDQYQALVQNTLADPLGTADTPGDRLYVAVLAPVVKWIPAGSSVVIVPDGALHRLNFETLPVKSGEHKHYWIEDATIQIAPSLAMLSQPSSRPQAGGRSLLLVGDPTPRAPEFPALTYASAEMAGITKHFDAGAVTQLRAEAASPSAFRKAGPEKFSAIHFTSHAVANTESPMDSAVILSGPDGSFKLYARDVADLPLAADLVTVSACRSAGERTYSGEGLVGFAWAFLHAGSRRVVAGLWDVDDRSTASLMENFYARLANGDAPATALRAAKLHIMKEGTMRPYYWGPLQMFTVSS
jgi:CHAT domain-containing protein/tetratricopeptide (TPR) repeat protein